MAKMLNISMEESKPIWLNLDLVLMFETTTEAVQDPGTTHVVAFTAIGGTGLLLPPHISLENVLKMMSTPERDSIFRRHITR